jgi:urease accessory protein
MEKFMKKIIITAAALLLPAATFAHTGHGTSGFSAGIAHPFMGLDHLLAMLAVGLWSARQVGAARWITPVTFVAIMAIGAVVGVSTSLAITEFMIIASVVAFGAMIAFKVRSSAVIAGAVAGTFALFHGLAHGAEMPMMSTLFTYGAGFILATALLHVMGFGLALLGHNKAADMSRRIVGAGIAVAGLALAVA